MRFKHKLNILAIICVKRAVTAVVLVKYGSATNCMKVFTFCMNLMEIVIVFIFSSPVNDVHFSKNVSNFKVF